MPSTISTPCSTCVSFWVSFSAASQSWPLHHAAQQVVACSAMPIPQPNVPYWQNEVREPQRLRHRCSTRSLLFGHRDLLRHVARPDLVLDGVRLAVPGGDRPTEYWRWSILTLIGLSKAEPIKTILRVTEQHDLGKLCFAFTMLNMYLAFALVPDHLVGQLAGRDSLVPRPHSRQLGRGRHARRHLPLAACPSRCCCRAT